MSNAFSNQPYHYQPLYFRVAGHNRRRRDFFSYIFYMKCGIISIFIFMHFLTTCFLCGRNATESNIKFLIFILWKSTLCDRRLSMDIDMATLHLNMHKTSSLFALVIFLCFPEQRELTATGDKLRHIRFDVRSSVSFDNRDARTQPHA